jgi:hypothetical protein
MKNESFEVISAMELTLSTSGPESCLLHAGEVDEQLDSRDQQGPAGRAILVRKRCMGLNIPISFPVKYRIAKRGVLKANGITVVLVCGWA